ncbi:DNA protecting protein DprA [Vibrio sp. 10N.286.49.B3]|uniref:DNA-processing protein DprA n=1 Tax=Vibrio sp. 10N.286.49.B3 TaxID=1880855 RepID=UPI000C85DA7F|nr:DNA-processing protein DprA [Vibrio sp. 10N.286.49.B3]PMH45381.1 DNA protecting protein DprA [Vibrio sp. 10N.286.49.B3]
MSETELAAWLMLSFAPNIGSKKLSKLLAIDAPHHLMAYSHTDLQAIGLTAAQIHYFKSSAAKEVESCLQWRAKNPSQNHIITSICPDYPPLLKQIASYPPVLFVKGNLATLSKPQIAMVGSRHASSDALQCAVTFARSFVEQDLVVTSGLALGVDGHAHDGALQAEGETLAVLGSGVEHIYPARHRGLAKRIVEQGALVSEFRPDAKPRAEHFPRRNRIISGLSVGVLVVEAAERSGSLITARYAMEQGRDVFALPGSIHQVNSRGGNRLIQSGAYLVQSGQEVIDEIEQLKNWSIQHQPSLFEEEPAYVEVQASPFPELFANIKEAPISVDILAQKTHIPVNEVMMQLLELELLGHVTAINGGYIRNGRG